MMYYLKLKHYQTQLLGYCKQKKKAILKKKDKKMSMNNMGKPINEARRHQAYIMLEDMGVKMKVNRYLCVREVANYLERDEPFSARKAALKYIDLTGTYRLLATLLV